jgi:hypothetical protein
VAKVAKLVEAEEPRCSGVAGTVSVRRGGGGWETGYKYQCMVIKIAHWYVYGKLGTNIKRQA